MKKVLSLIMVLTIMLSLVACGGGNKKAFEASKLAYDEINKAYKITEQFGSDIYEAWRLGIYDDEEIIEDGVAHLASELSLTEAEITEGIAYFISTKIAGKDWETVEESEKEEFRKSANAMFGLMKDDLFSFCVNIVSSSYIVNGKTAEAQEALNTAKAQMKELSEKYSDYEHYPNLKGYYTATSSFFDFCQNPTGSFEQVKNTVNDYKNEIRDYISDLDYVFEE